MTDAEFESLAEEILDGWAKLSVIDPAKKNILKPLLTFQLEASFTLGFEEGYDNGYDEAIEDLEDLEEEVE